MNWKPSILVPILAVALTAAIFAWQEPTPQMEVFATGRGNFVAWPAGMLDKTDALQLASQAEADLASAGRISAGVVQDLVIKTKSVPPRRPAPRVQSASAPDIRAMQLRVTDQDCDGAARACANARGAACQPGQPGCRCGCISPLAPGASATEAIRTKRNGVVLFLIAPSADAVDSSARMALQTMHEKGYYFKF